MSFGHRIHSLYASNIHFNHEYSLRANSIWPKSGPSKFFFFEKHSSFGTVSLWAFLIGLP